MACDELCCEADEMRKLQWLAAVVIWHPHTERVLLTAHIAAAAHSSASQLSAVHTQDTYTHGHTLLHYSYSRSTAAASLSPAHVNLLHHLTIPWDMYGLHVRSAQIDRKWHRYFNYFYVIFTLRKKGISPNLNNIKWYKARHAHKRLYTVLPKYSKIQVLPGITSCRLVKDNKQAIELNSLLLNNMPKDGYGWN